MSNRNGISGYTHTQTQIDDYANQNNPNSHEYNANNENHANKCKPNKANYAGHKK